ncbi:hypothetical protein Tco_0809893 [Tanacetum coccineum]
MMTTMMMMLENQTPRYWGWEEDYDQPLEFVNRRSAYQKKIVAAVRAEIEVLRRERLAYEQESIQTRQDLTRSEAHCRALEARVIVLETDAHRHECGSVSCRYLCSVYMLPGLEAGSIVDTLEDTGSSS